MSIVKKSFAVPRNHGGCIASPDGFGGNALPGHGQGLREQSGSQCGARRIAGDRRGGLRWRNPAYRPTIAAEAITTSTNTNGFVNNTASVGVSINQTLFDGFQTRNNVARRRSPGLRGTREILPAAPKSISCLPPCRPMPMSPATTRSWNIASRTYPSCRSSSRRPGPDLTVGREHPGPMSASPRPGVGQAPAPA